MSSSKPHIKFFDGSVQCCAWLKMIDHPRHDTLSGIGFSIVTEVVYFEDGPRGGTDKRRRNRQNFRSTEELLKASALQMRMYHRIADIQEEYRRNPGDVRHWIENPDAPVRRQQ